MEEITTGYNQNKAAVKCLCTAWVRLTEWSNVYANESKVKQHCRPSPSDRTIQNRQQQCSLGAPARSDCKKQSLAGKRACVCHDPAMQSDLGCTLLSTTTQYMYWHNGILQSSMAAANFKDISKTSLPLLINNPDQSHIRNHAMGHAVNYTSLLCSSTVQNLIWGAWAEPHISSGGQIRGRSMHKEIRSAQQGEKDWGWLLLCNEWM